MPKVALELVLALPSSCEDGTDAFDYQPHARGEVDAAWLGR
jgi:hypothetical protein